MKKISQDFIVDQYRSGVESYSDFTLAIGLWDSERQVFEQYLNPDNAILDLGCGTGRTTFGLYQMGYKKIIGVDLTPEMIEEARRLNVHFGTTIEYVIGDATQLDLPDDAFDAVVFSFNGIMSIPKPDDRRMALKEIRRVLREGGTFIFTTHDREEDENYLQFWKEERARWAEGEIDERVYEFGDLITTSKNESREIFIHIPDRAEVENWLAENCFKVEDTFYRSERFTESEAVRAKSGECRFWITRKI